MNIETSDSFSRQKCMENIDKLFVFGENKEQQGSLMMGGGQAIIRGMYNSYGFCTLESIGEYWNDSYFFDCKNDIDTDILILKLVAAEFSSIVFPKYGLGTGRAGMQRHCPLTFMYMNTCLLETFGFNNIEHLKVPNY